MPWSRVVERLASRNANGALLDVVATVLASDHAKAVRATPIRHNTGLVLVRAEQADPPFDAIIVQLTGVPPWTDLPEGGIVVEHVAASGATEAIARPGYHAVRLFWRMAQEKWGLSGPDVAPASASDARGLALSELARMGEDSGLDLVLVGDANDGNWCWWFGYNNRPYVETGVAAHALAGNGPIVIDKVTRDVHHAGSAEGPEDAVATLGRDLDSRTCPVCGHVVEQRPYLEYTGPGVLSGLGPPPYAQHLGRPTYGVCACCGFEFGNDDNPGTARPSSFARYRLDWLDSGAPWFKGAAPAAWSLARQLARILDCVNRREVDPDEGGA